MNIEFEWVFGKFKIAKSENNLINVVKSLNWILIAKVDEYEANKTGTIELNNPSQNSFVDIKDLAKDLVESWVVEKLTQEKVDSLKNEIKAEINQKISSNFKFIDPVYKS